MSRYKAYPEYKDSGVEWVGEIPVRWKVAPFFSQTLEIKRSNKGLLEKNVLSLSYGKIIRKRQSRNVGLVPESYETYQIVEPSEIVFRFTDLQNDKNSLRSGLVQERGIISSAYVAVKPMGVTSPFAAYLMRSYDTQKVFYGMAGGLRQSLRFADVKRLPLVFPEITEQSAITVYLDHETTRIDSLIEKKTRFIELLKEKRQALITHAVTKGLDPDVPMKDSGVEWIGEVPVQWDKTRLKYLVSRFEQGWSPQCETVPADKDEWGVLKVGCVNGGVFKPNDNKALPSSLIPKPELAISAGDVLVSRANTRELVGSCAVAKIDYPRRILCDKLYRIRPNNLVLGDYLASVIQVFGRSAAESDASGASASMVNISMRTLSDMTVYVPRLKEQRNINQRVYDDTKRIDTLVAKIEQSIELLKEKRSALITAAVTGKIDVREQRTEAA